jgi:hypothetical protein
MQQLPQGSFLRMRRFFLRMRGFFKNASHFKESFRDFEVVLKISILFEDIFKKMVALKEIRCFFKDNEAFYRHFQWK